MSWLDGKAEVKSHLDKREKTCEWLTRVREDIEILGMTQDRGWYTVIYVDKKDIRYNEYEPD